MLPPSGGAAALQSTVEWRDSRQQFQSMTKIPADINPAALKNTSAEKHTPMMQQHSLL